MLSVDASHASDTLPDVTPVPRRFPGAVGAWVSPPLPPAGTVWVPVFHPETRTDGAEPLRSDVRYRATSVVVSPGHRLTALSFHRTGSTGAPAESTTWAST